MNIKYLKNPKTREKFYPITKSDCIIDAFSINDLEIDKLCEDSLSVSKHQKGMSYLNLQGLIHYHSKIKDYFNNIPEVQIYTAGENITIENNVISAVVPEVDLSGYATEAYVDQEIANIDIPSLDGYATEQWVEEQGYIKNIPPHTVTINFYNDIDYAVWHNMVGDIEITSMQSTNVLNLYLSDGVSLSDQDVSTLLQNGSISITNGSTLTFDVIKTTDANGFAAVTLTYNIK